jgi:hypothetical protein
MLALPHQQARAGASGGFKADDTPEQKLEKLEAILALDKSRVQAVVRLFAALLSIPFGERYAPFALSPTQQRRRTLAALLDQFEGSPAGNRSRSRSRMRTGRMPPPSSYST